MQTWIKECNTWMLWIKIDEKWFTFSFRLKILNNSTIQAKNHEIYYTLFIIFKPYYYTANFNLIIKERKKEIIWHSSGKSIKVVWYLSQLPKKFIT
jgi:hypothetical protein